MHRFILPVLLLTTLAAASAPSATQPDSPATQPTAQSHPRFTSINDILNKTPEAFRPRQYTPDWTTFDEYKFKDWVNKQIAGMIFDDELQVAGTNVFPNPTASPGHEWQVDVSFNLTRFACFGSTHGLTIALPPLTTAESSARKWKTLKAGTRIKIHATIKAVYIMRRNFTSTPHPQYEFALILEDPQLAPPQ